MCKNVVNTCYIAHGTGVRKVSNNKSDLQDHSRSLLLVPFDRPHDFLLVFHCYNVSLVPFPRYNLSVISEKLKRLHDGVIYHKHSGTRQYQSAHQIWNAQLHLFKKHDGGPKIQTSSQRILTKGCIAAADFVMEESLMWHLSVSAADKGIGALTYTCAVGPVCTVAWCSWKSKTKSSYIAPFVVCIISKPYDMDHTVLPANYKMPAVPRKHSPDGATPNCGSRHPIPTYYSFIDLKGMKGWVGLVAWPIADGLPM